MNPVVPIEYVVVLLLVLGGASVMASWRSSVRATARTRALLLSLRTAVALLLACVALNPGRWMCQREAQPATYALLVDRSRSMATRDAAAKSRWEEACAQAGRIEEEMPRVARVEIRPFADSLGGPTSVADLAAQRADGAGSDVLSALEDMLDRHASGAVRLDEVVLFSDGRQVPPRDPAPVALEAVSLGVPVSVVPLGGLVPPRDLQVTPVRVHLVAFSGQPFRLGVRVRNSGLGPIRPELQLTDARGGVVAREKAELDSGQTTTVAFRLTAPEDAGQVEYRVRTPPWPGERVLANNAATVTVSVFTRKLRILMAEGTPYWDSKFLAQLLRRQANMELTEVYRVAQGRFFRIAGSGTQSGPRTNEPVFPTDYEALADYDALIFGKGVEYFLGPEQVGAVHRFVRDHGGCVVFARGRPHHRDMPGLSVLAPVSWGRLVARKLQWRPTVEGERLRLFGNSLPGANDPVWQTLPPVTHIHECPQTHGFAHILARAAPPDETGEKGLPLVVARRVGRGLVVAVTAEGLWQWDFFAAVEQAKALYQAFWPQLLQWALTFSDFLPGQMYSLQLSRTAVMPGTPVRVLVNRRAGGSPAAAPSARVTCGEAHITDLALEVTGRDVQAWEGVLALSAPGLYTVQLRAEDDAQVNTQPPAAALQVLAPPSEDDELSADPDFLRRLAEETGGRVLPRGDDALSRTLEPRRDGQEDPQTADLLWVPAWDRSWAAALLFGLLTAEWFLRRKSALT